MRWTDRRTTPALVLIAFLSACSPGAGALPVPTPETPAVGEVDRLYQQEFATALPRLDGGHAPPGSFAGTLAAIEQARGAGVSPASAAALTVREGLILLQTGEVAQAQALGGEVAEAAAILDSGGSLSRDALVARAWPALVSGETALAAPPSAPRGSDAAQAAELRRAAVLAEAGGAIRRTLCAMRRQGRLSGGDEGASLLAAYGSIYLANADAAAVAGCVLNPAAATLSICVAAGDRRHLREARDLMQSFLPSGGLPADRIARVAAAHGRSLGAAVAPDAAPPPLNPCT